MATQVSTDWRRAAIALSDYAMLDFGEKLTLNPGTMTERDIAALRAHGFSDRDILSIILAAAYRNYIVRVADALGVELNPTVDYAPELIRAFGVDDRQARSTLYADRGARGASGPASELRRIPAGRRPGGKSLWLDTEPEPEAAGEFQRSAAELERLTAPSPWRNLAKAFARRPDALGVTAEYLRLTTLGGSGLPPRLEAIIGLAVAAALSSRYLSVHYAERLLAAGGTGEEIEALVLRSESATFDPAEQETIRFCQRLTNAPSTMTRADVESLRAVEFQDRDIITIAGAVSLGNFVCRVADGAGVPLEPQAKVPSEIATFCP